MGRLQDHSAEEVLKLRGKYKLRLYHRYSNVRVALKKLNNQDFVAGLGTLTGNQAVQEVMTQVLEMIYLSGCKLPQMRIFLEKCILTNRFILQFSSCCGEKNK